jgi:hypothetical protein
VWGMERDNMNHECQTNIQCLRIQRCGLLLRFVNKARCERVRQKLKEEAPFVHRVEFIEALAALTSLFKEEVSMCSGQSSIK